MSRPSSSTWPSAGSTIRSTDWAVVVLPQPDSPTRATISPARTSKETPSTARAQRRPRNAPPPRIG
jgi:hypothetical protein